MSENSGICERLREARAKAGLTQEQACKQARIPKTQTLSTYERGTSTPRLDTLMELVKLYGVSADWVLFGKERVNEDNRQKSPAEYLAQLVEAVDRLGLEIGAYSNFGGDIQTEIKMCSSKYIEIDTFSDVWCKYRKLVDDGSLDRVDYELLIEKRIPNQFHQKDKQPNQCEQAVENGELPVLMGG